ncbi:unnamed protein product [Camellia sinensis]
MGFRRAIFVTMGIVAMLGYTYDWMDFKLTKTSLMGFKLTRTTSLINVLNFGAIGDGIADDSQVHYFIHACPYISLHGDAMQRNHTLLGAFLKAWSATCGSTSNGPSMIIPGNKTFLVKQPVRFEGPCKSSSINVQVWGDIKAPDMMNFGDINSHTWLVFSNVDGLIVSGTGQIDGSGKSWWDSCPTGTDCKTRPAALTFNRCNNLQLSGLRHVDSANNHISITNCAVVTISNIHITAPETSPNTDGIDISNSNRIVIHDSYIGTGDDCIAMINGCKYINITGVNCGPGHGISIGSLGKNGSRATVEELHVKNCTFNGTQNGARIKTWQGGSGYAKIISFVDIILIETGNPILIDQYYCPHNTCKDQTSAVGISNVSFTGFRGTTNTIDAIQLSCSKNVPCTDIELNQINIMPAPDMKPGTILQSTCINAHGTSNTSNNPKVNCLL